MDELHAWHGYSSTDSLLPLCRYCNPRWEDKDPIALDPDYAIDPPADRATAINYELAGRGDPGHSFKDFRSPSKARRRHRERNEKYYSWRGVKPGQLNRPHYTPNDSRGSWYTVLLSEAAVSTMTKAHLYREAQMYPRPPKLHRSKPWDKAPHGATECHAGPKHARQRMEKDIGEVMHFAMWRTGAKGVWARRDWTPSRFGEEAMFALTAIDEIDAIGRNECGCRCDVCHRECHEQERRERRGEETNDGEDVGKDEEWDVLSTPSTATSEGSWDMLDVASGLSDGDWILPQASTSAPPLYNPFIDHEHRYFNEAGYLPYTEAHFHLDLATSRCRACIAHYLAELRLAEYTNARLVDFAVLRGMPIDFTHWTCRAGVTFRMLLPFIVEISAGAYTEDGKGLVEAARGPLVEEYYRMMEPSWWTRRDCKANPAARWTEDIMWMLELGCE